MSNLKRQYSTLANSIKSFMELQTHQSLQSIENKNTLRTMYKRRRREFVNSHRDILTDNFLQQRFCPTIQTIIRIQQDSLARKNNDDQGIELRIAGYWPLANELNVKPILKVLQRQNYSLCLPVVIKPEHPLIFRSWSSEDKLEQKGQSKIFEPLSDKQEVVPDVMLVPMLAFNEQCHRLGFGGGYYDRTISNIQRDYNRILLTIGLAFEKQKFDPEIDGIPPFEVSETDQQLDYIVTEKKVYCKDRRDLFNFYQ